MSDWPELDAALDAARSDDQRFLGSLIDWPLAGFPTLARAIGSLPEYDRSSAVANGLDELYGAASSPGILAVALPPVAARLAAAATVVVAPPEIRDRMLGHLRVPPLPPGLTADQTVRLDELRRRAEAIADVYVVLNATEPYPLARAADTNRLVPLLR